LRSSTPPYDCIFLIHNKTTYRNRTNIVGVCIRYLSYSTDAKTAIIKILKNPTVVTTPVWNDIDTNNSVVQYSLNDTITGGIELLSMNTAPSSCNQMRIKDFDMLLEPGDILAACVRVPTGQLTEVSCSINWSED
jgi:hypothetical protein